MPGTDIPYPLKTPCFWIFAQEGMSGLAGDPPTKQV